VRAFNTSGPRRARTGGRTGLANGWAQICHSAERQAGADAALWPHGLEPSRRRVLECPAGSVRILTQLGGEKNVSLPLLMAKSRHKNVALCSGTFAPARRQSQVNQRRARSIG